MTTSDKCPNDLMGCDTESKPFVNRFSNDGSFLETFKKMQQEQQSLQKSIKQSINCSNDKVNDQESIAINIKKVKNSTETIEIESSNDKKINSTDTKTSTTTKIMMGKRRNQKLKVGIIKRDRKEVQSEDDLDAWSKYMKEVRQYKEKYGDDSDKKRPLVK